jgi:hypothetical protein
LEVDRGAQLGTGAGILTGRNIVGGELALLRNGHSYAIAALAGDTFIDCENAALSRVNGTAGT